VVGSFIESVKTVSNGTATISGTFGPLRSGIHLEHIVLPEQSFSLKQDAFGKISGASSVPQMAPTFPREPIKIGGSWDGSTSTQAMGSNSKLSAHYTLERTGVVKGRPVAVVAVTLRSTGQADTSGAGELVLLTSDGSLWSSNVRMSLTAPDGSTLLSRMSISR
jgi:hypothetical protein